MAANLAMSGKVYMLCRVHHCSAMNTICMHCDTCTCEIHSITKTKNHQETDGRKLDNTMT